MHEKEGMGTLSTDKVQSLKYHFAISAALVARYCIEVGMPVSKYIIKMKLSTAKKYAAILRIFYCGDSSSLCIFITKSFYGCVPQILWADSITVQDVSSE